MIYKLFAVKDKALNSFSAPYTQGTIESGIRMWRELVLFQQEENRYRRSPNDFTLYLIGEYDDDTGQIENVVPQPLATASEVINEHQQQRNQDNGA